MTDVPLDARRILVTGSRGPISPDDRTFVIIEIRSLIRRMQAVRPGEIVVVHGDAPGVDQAAADAATGWPPGTVAPEPHPAKWRLHGRAAGPIRNQEMVDLGAIVCLAFPAPSSKGTWVCVRMAALARPRIPIHINSIGEHQ